MLVITLNKENQALYQEDFPAHYRPKNGFEHRADGNYYKRLGDPRNITDEERKRKLLAEKREIPICNNAEQPKRVPTSFSTESIRPGKYDSSDDSGDTKELQAEQRITIEQLKEWTHGAAWVYQKDNVVTMYGPQMLSSCGLKELERRSFFAIIKLDTVAKTISLWDTNPNRLRPNTLLTDALQ
jgi:hypothetical protein